MPMAPRLRIRFMDTFSEQRTAPSLRILLDLIQHKLPEHSICLSPSCALKIFLSYVGFHLSIWGGDRQKNLWEERGKGKEL
jgi:hypothetical protein